MINKLTALTYIAGLTGIHSRLDDTFFLPLLLEEEKRKEKESFRSIQSGCTLRYFHNYL